MNKKIELQVVATVFLLLAIALRFVPIAHNFAAVGAMGLFVGCFWSARMGVLFTLAAMGISDLLGHWFNVSDMGYYSPTLMLTVYLSMALAPMIGKLLSRKVNPVTVPLAALATTATFFLVTNLAVWLDPLMPYAMTPAGLLQCYVAALPFVKNTLIGDVVFSAIFFGSYAYLAAPQSAPMRVRAE